MEWREQDGIRWLEASLPGAKTAFTTRVGGASEPPFASLNLGILTGDEVRLVRGNRRRLASALELSPTHRPHALCWSSAAGGALPSVTLGDSVDSK